MPTKEQTLEALDAMDDYARMEAGVDPIGPREALRKFIEQSAADLARVTHERDEALADAVRLRAAIDNIAAVWDDPHSSLVAELRAIQDAQALAATPATTCSSSRAGFK